MRVLHLINHCGHANGNVHAAVDLACAQSLAGYSVAMASAGGYYEPLLRENGVTHINVPQNLRQPRSLFKSLRELVKFCRGFKPDVLHAHMMSGALIGYAVSRMIGRPLVTTVHNSFDKHSALMLVGDAAVAVSQAEYERLTRTRFGSRKIHKVLNGPLGSPRYGKQAAGPASARQRIVASVCGLHARKGVADILVGFAAVADKFPEWSLVIGGEGPDFDSLVAKSQALGIAERTTFLGMVSSPIEVLRTAEIFVIASIAEPFGLAVVEARSAGCAIIGARTGGITEILGDGEYGILVNPSAPQDIASALDRLIGDDELRARFQAKVATNLGVFSSARLMEGYEEVYAGLRAAVPRRPAVAQYPAP